MTFFLLVTVSFVAQVIGHAYLNKPVSRNAVSSIANGYCSWSGGIPCTGDSQSWNVEETTTGCGISQGGGGPYTHGNGALAYSSTGIKTTVTAGEVVDMEIKVAAYHGGRFEFRIQDVGASSDPDGSQWMSRPLLTVDSFSPICDNPVYCGVESCVATKTCAQLPMSSYGVHNGLYNIKVKIPNDLECNHCVLQWMWVTANSCGGSKVSCDQSEHFWNCADLQVVGGTPTTVTTNTPIVVSPSTVVTSSPDAGEDRCHAIDAIVSDFWCLLVFSNPDYAFVKEDDMFGRLCACSRTGTTNAPIADPTEDPVEAPSEDPTETPVTAPTEAPTRDPNDCPGPFSAGFPNCENQIIHFKDKDSAWFEKRGMDGSRCDLQDWLHRKKGNCPPVTTLAPIPNPTVSPSVNPTDAPTDAPNITPAPSDAPVLVCKSITDRPDITDAWCMSVNCHAAYEDFCGWVPVSTDAPSPGPIGPSAAPVSAPTKAPIVGLNHIGIYDWTWDGATATPPTNANLGVAFSGWANIDNALYESSLIESSLTGDKYLSIGGGNANGHLNANRLEDLNTAIIQGRLEDYQGVCYDVEVGDSDMASAFAASFVVAKANNLKVLVTISHSAPYGFPDKIALMDHFFTDENIDIISPQMYTTGNEASNDFVWDGVPWSSYANSKAEIVPSIVRASYYEDLVDFFDKSARSGASESIAVTGFIQWKQS